MQKEPKTLNQRKNAERKLPIEAASIRDALFSMPIQGIFERQFSSAATIRDSEKDRRKETYDVTHTLFQGALSHKLDI